MRCDCPELGSDFEHCLSSEIAPAKQLSQHPIDFSKQPLRDWCYRGDLFMVKLKVEA